MSRRGLFQSRIQQMSDDSKNLEQKMLQLPNLKYIGLALMEFTFAIQSGTNVKMEADDIFRFHFVAFGFSKDKEAIRLHLPFEVIKDIEKRDLRFLPMVKDTTYCEVIRPLQLAAAVRYIELSHGHYLTTRQTLNPTRN
jgi:hypothetical protein